MAITYRLIGKGTTSNGVAHMTKKTTNGGSTWTDCNGYTGTGKGRLNLIASTDSTITSGSLQSEPYELLDALFYDNGLTNHDSTNYSIASTLSEETVDDGVQISKTASGSTNARYICNTGSSDDIQAEITTKTDNVVRFGFIDTNSQVSYISLNNSEWNNIKIKRINNTITASINGTQVTLATNNADATDTLKFFIQIYNTSTTVNAIWKDLKIYPI